MIAIDLLSKGWAKTFNLLKKKKKKKKKKKSPQPVVFVKHNKAKHNKQGMPVPTDT